MSFNNPMRRFQFYLLAICLNLSGPALATVASNINDQESQRTANIVAALTQAKTPNNIIVAVIDTGVDYTHEDLQGRMWINSAEQAGLDGVDDDHNGCVDDIYGCDFRAKVKEKLGYYPGIGGAYYRSQRYIYPDDMGHGTMVAGIIGAVADNGVGINGVSQSVKIMSVKIIYPYNVASMEDAAKAIRYAVDNGAHIINNSYGKSRIKDTDLALLEDAIDYANQQGVLVIAAAGNNAANIDRTQSYYPANIDADNLISVTAITQQNQLWEHANFGPWSVDIAAPGQSILTTVPKGQTSLFRKFFDPSGYLTSDGTSMATSFVSGLAALLSSYFPSMTHLQIKQTIMDTSQKIPALADKLVAGGRIDIYHALRMAAAQYDTQTGYSP